MFVLCENSFRYFFFSFNPSKPTNESENLTTSIVQPDIKEKISLMLKKESSHDSHGNSKMT